MTLDHATLLSGPTLEPLDTGWTLRAVGGPVPGPVLAAETPVTVPGTVHTDLLGAGLIPDPYRDRNEFLVGWIGESDWSYTRTIAAPLGRHERVDLVFDGLDTVAEVVLDEVLLAQTFNQHRSYRLDVTDALSPGTDHTLTVTFRSPVRYADRMSLALGYRPQVNSHPYPAIRKMACSFGWDWGPDLATSGIWRPARLHAWSVARIEELRTHALLVDAHGDDDPTAVDGLLRAHVRLERTGSDVPVTVRVRIAGAESVVDVATGQTDVVVEVPVAEVRRWWPAGYGTPELYDVQVDVVAEGAVLDSRQVRAGFRTVALDTSADEIGHGFTFVVNGERVFVKGANWIPDDAFPHRVDAARYRARVEQARDAGMNLLRVWGGGIYESDDFYDACDELGVLTWQDFPFACAAYAEEEPLYSEVEAEARENVARIMNHPSLVLWNGSNENFVGFEEWGWPARLEGRTWGLGYYERLLPGIVADLDGRRPYTPSSPWSVEKGIATGDTDHGSMHLWETWNRLDWVHYRDAVPRFAAEWGWQAPPAWRTLRDALSDDPLTPESPGMLTHQKAITGNDKLTDGLVPHLRFPDRVEDWVWAMQLNQAHALDAGVTHHRSWWPRCAGTVVWQLNDMWPVTSWALVDGAQRAKPAYFAVRHAFADRVVTIQPREDALSAVVVNDTGEEWTGDLVLRRAGFDGVNLAEQVVPVTVAPRATVEVPLPETVLAAGDETAELVVASLGDARGLWYFVEPRDSALAAHDLEVRVEVADGGYDVTVRANNLVRDLVLLADVAAPDATVDDTLHTLLPGEEVVLRVRTSALLDVEILGDPLVLRSANQLVAR